MKKIEVSIQMELSVKDADYFCQQRGVPNLHLVRDVFFRSSRCGYYKPLIQLNYWRMCLMLEDALIKESEYAKPNAFTELVENVEWHIENLKSKHQWLLSIDEPNQINIDAL